ncbi:MAG: HD domain-containing protein [Mariprofundaceae bacterium]|nr:HD domain-containing protein [Mariprofundaceae bacterium]
MPYSDLKQQLNVMLNGALSSAFSYRDKDTHAHSVRVVQLCHDFASFLSLGDQDKRILSIAALFHDVGKIGIPDSIISKEGKLSKEEWKTITKHPKIGKDIVKRLKTKDADIIASVVEHHHEYYNGKGYPNGLKGKKIPLASRVISLLDSYDALTSDRDYRIGMSHEKAISIMKSEVGVKFDPTLAASFFQHIEHIIAT